MSDRDEANTHFDVTRALDGGRWSSFQKWIFVFGIVAFLVEGLASQLLGLTIPSLMKEWGLPRSAFTPTAVAGLIGVTVGNAAGGVIGDRLGRKWGIILSMMLYGVMDMAAILIHTPAELGAVRLAAGLGIGAMVPNAIALVAEATPAHRRARAVGAAILGLPFGSGVAGYIGSILLPLFGWRSLFIMGGVVPIFFAVLFMAVLPESPAYLARMPGMRTQLAALLSRMGIALPADAMLSVSEKKTRATVRELFGPGMTRDTVGLWGIAFFSFMATYTFLNWGPAMLTGAGLDLRLSSLGITFWSVGAVGSLLIGFTIERHGSLKTLIAVFCVLAVLTSGLLAMMTIDNSSIPYFFAAIAVLGTCAVAVMSAGNVLGSHLYPTSCRTTGLGASAAVGRLGAITGVVLGDISLHLNGTSGYFLFIGGALFMSLLFALGVRRHVPKAV